MTAAIILAAGESSRFGSAKQNLLYKGKTLLEIALEAALRSTCELVVVVLGAYSESIISTIRSKNVQIIPNDGWSEGIASSIKVAITYVKRIAEVDSAVLMLCDQPFVSPALIDNLIYKKHQTDAQIVACIYLDTIGAPALFDRILFDDLLLLQGHEGAKKVILSHPNRVNTILFEKGAIDIDTVADYENLIKDS